jgi:Lrp/AsnC family transcriptional regulator, leucine-responsive regulatory protein
MTSDHRPGLDRVDQGILAELQGAGRVSVADLARRVSLSASSAADRLRRLVDDG